MVAQGTVDELYAIVDDLEFIYLGDPKIRNVDRIWAKELFGNDAEMILDEAQRLLTYLSNIRNPQ